MIELSVLIPSIADRAQKAAGLFQKVAEQAKDKPVEVLMLSDNRKLELNVKRNNLMRLSTGNFIAHLDDDDDVSPDYIDAILGGIAQNPATDVISFDQISDLGDKMPFRVSTSLLFENQDAYNKPDGSRGDITRKPWHWCAWKGSLARTVPFPTSAYGEDWSWLREMLKGCYTEVKIPKVLHYYFWTKTASAFG